MTEDEFWATVEAARGSGGECEEIAARLKLALEARAPEEIYGYLEVQGRLMARTYRWDLWGAAYVANGGCSDDGFDYFRGWLFAQGRDVFEAAEANPDSIAAVDFEMDEAFCEDMIGAGVGAYKTRTGDYPDGPPHRNPELGEGWDFDDDAEMTRRYPALAARFLT